MKKIIRALALACCAIPTVQADSISLTYNYIATNRHGSAGVSPVASLTLTDLSDLGLTGEGSGGVRATLTNLGTDQFGSGSAGTTTWIGSFELNFPNTDLPDYDSSANLGIGNHWANVSGTPLGPGGVEWAEGGATNNWAFFGQEFNFTGSTFSATTSLTQGRSSTIDIFNAPGLGNISVAGLLGSAVTNSADSSKPALLSWIKLRGTTNTDPALRGIAASGYWGNSASTANSYRLDVVATAPVPIPPAAWLFGSALVGMGLIGRRRES